MKVNKVWNTVGIILFVFILALFLTGDRWNLEAAAAFKNVNTIFVSIILEALPFILIGVLASALIQTFVSEDQLKKWIPKNPFLAILPAAFIGALLPICECAIVPVARRLMKKGMPVHVAIVIMVTAPILNPVVFASTYYAFQTEPIIYWGRFVLAFIFALVIGLLIYFTWKNANPLKGQASHHHHHHHGPRNKWIETIQHASDEFFDMGKFLILGALVAAIVQTFLDRAILVEVGANTILGPLSMMGLAYVLSLCSEADAFVASSFGSQFSVASILAFLVYGPMIDLKNTILMLAYFNWRFVLRYIAIVTGVVFVGILLFQGIL
ncbi:membrane protein [Bacillus coahuilensis p1.1.43]|uniref:Membrane protein n=1 Tax=Bacillus coahuilensis p1.1.43 TaxID=1150625 RepID=A0A147KBI5_9BACI|nr:permease [Bacillus coahuilensis]KUP08517.1 membrane protein [Bacillus coahuilensis p1.1.43]